MVVLLTNSIGYKKSTAGSRGPFCVWEQPLPVGCWDAETGEAEFFRKKKKKKPSLALLHHIISQDLIWP